MMRRGGITFMRSVWIYFFPSSPHPTSTSDAEPAQSLDAFSMLMRNGERQSKNMVTEQHDRL